MAAGTYSYQWWCDGAIPRTMGQRPSYLWTCQVCFSVFLKDSGHHGICYRYPNLVELCMLSGCSCFVLLWQEKS